MGKLKVVVVSDDLSADLRRLAAAARRVPVTSDPLPPLMRAIVHQPPRRENRAGRSRRLRAVSPAAPARPPRLNVYGGQRAVRCPDCGYVSPSQEHLDIHRLRHCCGGWAA
jgi:hypothetical protein